MSYYRKKPVVIEARQFTGDETEARDIAAWCGGRYYPQAIGGYKGQQEITVTTLEGLHHARVGDWIIKGAVGEFYPVRPDVFALTYEAVDE